MTYTPDQFVADWERAELKERASAQSHFESVCRMIGHALPHELDPKGEFFTYEYGVQKSGGGQGFADVFYRGHFAIEYKGKAKYPTLDAAYQQLLRYRENLYNPPLLIVCDIERWEIHTNFPNTEKRVYKFTNSEVALPKVQRILHNVFHNPDALHPDRNTEQVTADAARVFERIAENMRDWENDPDRIAHFLTKLVFCLFAEDVALLPGFPNSGKGIFSGIVDQTRTNPAQFKKYAGELFRAMANGGDVLMQRIPVFDGLLFDDVDVEDLSYEALNELAKAASLDWSAIEPAIFGTLFERSLDPSKRAQLGAHYTSREDILLIVEPVLMTPLRRRWAEIRQRCEQIRAGYDSAETPRVKLNRSKELLALRDEMLHELRTVTILDPACGSGNFLYVSLHLLLDMEKSVIHDPLFVGLPLAFPEVHPRQLYGIELDPIAHALASIVVWIGYIQWRQNNGYMAFSEPILEPLHENIRRMDAIMQYDASGQPFEPEWPSTTVIVGNPPFLGGKRMRSELGDKYINDLFSLWSDHNPREADLVTYWFEKARAKIEAGEVQRAGLLSTNSIRGGANREVLKRIKSTGDIFMAWSDREWVLNGAAVRVSMVGFDNGKETTRQLDGADVPTINSDLTSQADATQARRLAENAGLAFMGVTPAGSFDIPKVRAQEFLYSANQSGLLNSDVIKPCMNAEDIVQSNREVWIIDFGVNTSELEAAKYELPFQYVQSVVLPEKLKSKQPEREKTRWWLFTRPRPELRNAVASLKRYIATPLVAKHRVFVFVNSHVIPTNSVDAIARDDDYFFGVLHSRIHEVWSLRTGTWLGKGNDPRYTPSTTFETFPFPWPPGHEDTHSAAYLAVAAAAAQLHAERQAWLDTPNQRKDRTLTNLYNALNVWRGIEQIKTKPATAEFAPRLDALHEALDRAVCDAYGWPHEILSDEEAILSRVLALNLARSQGE